MRKVTLLTIVLLVGTTGAAAQDTSTEKNRLLAKRAAEADAYRNLAEAVYGLQINSRTYVHDFVAESDDIRTEVDTVVKGIRLGDPIWYEDGSCEVPAEVTVAKVIDTLRSAHKRYYKGEAVKAADFETMAKRIDKRAIQAVGMGAPRPDLPPDLPAGVAESLGPASTDAAKPPIPPIWRNADPRARLMAIRAARVDALRKLAERIKGLRLTSRTQVRDFVAESDVITTELNAMLVGAEEVGTYLHHNDLIAEVTMRVATEKVVTTIRTLHSRHYEGDDLKGHDLEEIVKTVVKRDFEATGMGVPPAQYLRRGADDSATTEPAWTSEVLEATGTATDPAIDTAQGRLMAARAAELIAKRNLAETIAGLQAYKTKKIREVVAEYEDISAMVDAIVVDAEVVETRFTDDTAIVKVALPGMRVWRVIHIVVHREQAQ
jgi:hypothetical protein